MDFTACGMSLTSWFAATLQRHSSKVQSGKMVQSQPSSTLTPALRDIPVGMQVVIVQYGGKWFQTVPLTPVQWAACTGIGAFSLLVRAGLRLFPTNKK